MASLPWQQRLMWGVLVAFILGLMGAAIARKVNSRKGPSVADLEQPNATNLGSELPPTRTLAVIGSVGSFQFTDQDGKTLSAGDLRGKIWVAGFVFTRCSGSCLGMTASMKKLNEELAGVRDFRLVSFSLDPEYDTPEILTRYAKNQGVQSPRWHFLTGEKKSIMTVMEKSFILPAAEPGKTPQEPILHSEKLMLVDRAGRIRGAYNGTDPAILAELADAVRKLEREND